MAATIHHPGSATGQNTGDWRSERPVRDDSKCDKCGICWIFCPDAALFMDEDGFYEVDLFHCKGCGICARECGKGAITMVEEGE
ncbi:MAG: 4Fe-4S binding protein [Actinobacteria bacterium]|nr:4Fe-4S binding protein [Actinomycetota bacterium]MBU4179795.1 4Fe-4S binding protein [Actinomycetota bacterium]MBU4217507.1 4Fe-4S binding protein [Actinomycetota bacterium]MBU4358212.1 4Fe-4S binding protein [Actinomycetota bacterium]MBU4392602.1 4Fe-4S binding protein [Actinomycetota bacterium]